MGVRLDGITANSRRAVLLVARDGDLCAYCERALDDDLRTIDHVRPRSRGGGNATTNLLLACRPCNSMRGCADHQRFLAWRRANPHDDGHGWKKHRASAEGLPPPMRRGAPVGSVGSCYACHADWKLTRGQNLSDSEWRRWAGGCTCNAPKPRCAACDVYWRSEIIAGVPPGERRQRSPIGCTCDQAEPVYWAELQMGASD